MAMIEVNRKQLTDVAAAINTYCETQDREMGHAETAVNSMLTTDWRGQDAQEFRLRWEGVNANGSVTVNFRTSLRNYANGLIASENAYRQAQENAVNAAGILMRRLGQ